MDTYADDLAALVKELDLKDVIHIGHSTGGAQLDERTLVPGDDARLAATHFEDWLSRHIAGQYAASSSSPKPPTAATMTAAIADVATT
jgi:hypothetical protein